MRWAQGDCPTRQRQARHPAEPLRSTNHTMTTETKPVWHEIDPDTLNDKVKGLYASYKEAYEQAKAARETFESALRKTVDLGKGRRLAVAYNFGKLSVANVEETEKRTTGKKASSLGAIFGK